MRADDFHLPAPGVMVPLSPEFNPPILKGIKVNPENPFRFDFILDKGDISTVIPAKAGIQYQEQLKNESTKLIKYFLASLTIPEKDLWVNLSPYEKNRIIPQSFGLTEMGRDLLAEDYMLKQITASLIYPEGETGKRFWKRIYEEAIKRYGTTNIPVNTFNKVWIVPEKAVVYENAKAGTAYVVESKLKVMLEQDYLSLQKHLKNNLSFPNALVGNPANAQTLDPRQKHSGVTEISTLGSQIVHELIIPELTREVNEGKNFAQLRQVYNSLILATWYKKKIKDSILEQVYADKNKVKGVEYNKSIINVRQPGDMALAVSPSRLPSSEVLNVKAPQRNQPNDIELIYQRYLQAFKKGVYNYIKEDFDPTTQETIPRKYFSGGVVITPKIDYAMASDPVLIHQLKESNASNLVIRVNLAMSTQIDRPARADQAMAGVKLNKIVSTNSAMMSEESSYLIARWKKSNIEERAKMLVKSEDLVRQGHFSYDNTDFLMYVLLDSYFPFRRTVVEINNWGVVDVDRQDKTLIPTRILIDKFGRDNGKNIIKWLDRQRIIKIDARGDWFRIKQNIILDENMLRKFMPDNWMKLMRIFAYYQAENRLAPKAMFVDKLLQHLSQPWDSIEEEKLPKLTDHSDFDPGTGWANKRMAILILLIQQIVQNPRNNDSYESQVKGELSYEAEHMGDWSNNLEEWFKDLMKALESKDSNKFRAVLGEKRKMTFWEAFFRVYILFKWLDKKEIKNPYEWIKGIGFAVEFIGDMRLSNIENIKEKIDQMFDRAMRVRIEGDGLDILKQVKDNFSLINSKITLYRPVVFIDSEGKRYEMIAEYTRGIEESKNTIFLKLKYKDNLPVFEAYFHVINTSIWEAGIEEAQLEQAGLAGKGFYKAILGEVLKNIPVVWSSNINNKDMKNTILKTFGSYRVAHSILRLSVLGRSRPDGYILTTGNGRFYSLQYSLFASEGENINSLFQEAVKAEVAWNPTPEIFRIKSEERNAARIDYPDSAAIFKLKNRLIQTGRALRDLENTFYDKELLQTAVDRQIERLDQLAILADSNQAISTSVAKMDLSKTAVFIPPSGNHFVGMGQDLYEQYDYVRDIYQRAQMQTGIDLIHLNAADLQDFRNQQLATTVYEIALWEVLKREKFKDGNPKALIGVSRGFTAALYAAGVLDFKSAIEFVEEHVRFLEENALAAGNRRMALVSDIYRRDLTSILHQFHAVVAISISPQSCIISFPLDRNKEIRKAIDAQHGKFFLSKVSAASHDPHLLYHPQGNVSAEAYIHFLETDFIQKLRLPQIDVYSVTKPGHLLKTLKDIIQEIYTNEEDALPLDQAIAQMRKAIDLHHILLLGQKTSPKNGDVYIAAMQREHILSDSVKLVSVLGKKELDSLEIDQSNRAMNSNESNTNKIKFEMKVINGKEMFSNASAEEQDKILDRLMELGNRLYPATTANFKRRRDEMRQQLSHDNYFFQFLIDRNEQLCGYAKSYAPIDKIEFVALDAIVADPGNNGGTRLMRSMFNYLRNIGYSKVMISATSGAIGFYQKIFKKYFGLHPEAVQGPKGDNHYYDIRILLDEFYEAQPDFLPADNAQLANQVINKTIERKGGIDLTPANMNVQVKMDSRLYINGKSSFGIRGVENRAEGIRFHLTPAMFAQLQNAPGFVPVIISMQPVNLRRFLGLDVQKNLSNSSAA